MTSVPGILLSNPPAPHRCDPGLVGFDRHRAIYVDANEGAQWVCTVDGLLWQFADGRWRVVADTVVHFDTDTGTASKVDTPGVVLPDGAPVLGELVPPGDLVLPGS